MTNLRRVDLNLLTVFEAILAERNLTKASARIGMSQPAMSNALARLRYLFSDDLFVRQGNTMQPTARAQQLAIPIGRALESVRESLAEVDSFDPIVGRNFAIGGIELVDLSIMPRLLSSIESYVDSIHISTAAGFAVELVDKLKCGDLDLLVDISPLRDDEIEAQQIGTNEVISVVRADHPLAGRTLSLEETLELNHVIYETADDAGLFMEKFLMSHGVSNRMVAKVSHLFALPFVVAETDLVGTLPRHFAELFMDKFGLATVETALKNTRFPVLMMWHRSQTSDPGHRWLRDRVQEVGEQFLDS